MMEFVGGFVVGILAFIGYGAHRALSSDGWDDSNINNWLRLLSHVYIHPEDFDQMYYIPDHLIDEIEAYGDVIKKPFDYIEGDEFSDNFPDSRPE